MASDCKYNRLETVVSYDGGVSWESQTPPVYHMGTLIEPHSEDCETGTSLERWIVIEGDYLCDGNNKYKKELLENSFDGGVTWYPSNPTTFRLGQFVSVDEEYCSYLFEGHYIIPPNFDICGGLCGPRAVRILVNGICRCLHVDPVKIVKCSRDVITRDLLLNGSYQLVELLIGECAIGIENNSFNDVHLNTVRRIDMSRAINLERIENNTFSGLTSLSSVIFSNSITNIGNNAFAFCASLSSITIPSSVVTIGDSTFQGCTALSSITIPNSVISIGDSAFAQCRNLTGVTIGSGVTTIGNNAFTGCTAISSITVDSHNTTYDSRNNCNSIIETSTNRLIVGSNTSTIPSGVTTIGYGAFTNKNGLRSVVIPDSVTNFERPETSTVTFGDYAFANCTSLTSVTISNNITKLYGSFRDCTSLSNVTIPRSVDHIGLGAFRGCTSLTAITVEATTPPVMGRNETVFDDTNNCPIYVPCGTSSIYKSATGWSKYASRIQDNQVSCTKFIVTYSDTHTESGDCTSSTTISSTDISNKGDVVSIEIGSCAASIGYIAFQGCSGLTSITIPNTIASIGEFAFWGCSSLTDIVIPKNVTSINWGLFGGCNSLSSVVVDSNNTTYDSRDNCNAIIETSTNKLIAGSNTSTIPSGVTTIGYQAFNSCFGLTSVTIPNTVTAISAASFTNCTALTSVTIEATAPPTLDSGAFGNTNNCPIYVPCVSLTTYKTASGWSGYANRIQPISSDEQHRTTSGTPYCDGVDLKCEVYSQVSTDCGVSWQTTATTVVTVESGSPVCSSFNGKWLATYSDSHTESGACDSSSAITENEITMENLVSLEIGDCTRSLDMNAFVDYSGLTSVTMSNNITSIGKYAFGYCYNLISITIAAMTPPTLGKNALLGINVDCKIYVPAASVNTYKTASGWSSYADKIQPIT